MSRSWPFVILLALAGILGVLALQGPAAADGIVPLTTSLPPANTPSNPAAPAAPATSALDRDELPPRVEVALAADDVARDVVVSVRVEQQVGTMRAVLPGVEVALRSGDTTNVAGTDDRGEVEFVCKRGDGRPAVVRSVLGAAQELVLSAAASPQRVVLVVRPRLRVRGTVVDGAGNPVPQAAIMLLPWSGLGDDGPAPRRIGSSGADGSYEVALGVGGRLGAQHRVYGPSAMHLVQAPAETTEALPIHTLPLVLLATPAEVRGIVRDHDGRPVADAELEFRSDGKAPANAELPAVPQRVRTDAAGNYLATRLLPGGLRFGVRARGHGSLHGNLSVRPGESQQLDLRLPPDSVLTGTVRDADGSPVADATVVAGDREQFPPHLARTAADGTYRLGELPPATLELVALAAAPGGGSRRATTTLTLAAGDANVWHAVLPGSGPPPNLRGRLLDANARPLAGWRVVAIPAGQPPVQGPTGDDGTFALRTPADHLVDLRAYASGSPTTQFAAAVRRAVDPALGPVEFRVERQPTGRVVGRVLASDQAGLAASITCWHHERAEYVRLQAREDGVVRFDAPAGTLDLTFEHPGHASLPRRDLELGADTELDLGTIELGAGGALHGSVRGPDGSAPADCQLLVLYQGSQGAQRMAARYSGGNYRFDTLPVGKHTLVVQGQGLAAASFPITIDANVDRLHEVELRGGVRRRFAVVLPPGAPGSLALAFCEGGEICWLTTGNATGEKGTERRIGFDAYLAPGVYEAVAWATGGLQVRRAVTFVDGDDGEIELHLQKQ